MRKTLPAIGFILLSLNFSYAQNSKHNYALIDPGDMEKDIIGKAAHVTPSGAQLRWQQLELTAFLHFGVNTFTNKEWGDGTENPKIFNPTRLDARQWIRSLRHQFPDVLDVRNHVSDTGNVILSFFSNLGAWHAYGLPGLPEDRGGFTGPLIMDNDGRWLANSMARLQITEDNSLLDLSAATAALHYYPGLLQAEYCIQQLKIIQQLIFVSGRTAAVRTSIHNLSGRKRVLQLAFSGQALLANARLHALERSLHVDLGAGKLFSIEYDRKPANMTIRDKNYTTTFSPLTLGPDGTISVDQTQSYFPGPEADSPGKGRPSTPIFSQLLPNSFERSLTFSERRWNNYLSNVLPGIHRNRPVNAPDIKACDRLAVKSILTLVTNWRSPAKDLHHAGVFPSTSTQGFYAVWSWDSWKQAVALAYFNPGLAKDNIRCLFDYQDSSGMVPDDVCTNRSNNNLRDTKPPLAAWAVWEVYRHTHDRNFLTEMYPRLVRYHQWWYKYRDNNENGLCEYGSTDGTRIAAAWESGMDNAVRFDSARLLRRTGNAWSLNQESVDLNAYLYAEKLFLAKMARVLAGDASCWASEAKVLKEKIEGQFYSRSKGYYYDYNTDAAHLILTEGPEGWIPLWAGIPRPDRAARVRNTMMDTTKFNTFLPLPTLSADHPAFNPSDGYWRGPVWLDQFYFGIKGLRNYGFHRQADSLLSKFFHHTEGLWDTGEFRENYHPLTGKGLNSVNFSWSAAMVLLLLCGDEL